MKKNQQIINIITKYTIIFTLLIFILLSIFIRNNKSFVWINVSNDGLDQHLINLHYFKSLFNNFLQTGKINTFIWNIGYGMDMFANLAYYIFGDFLSYLALLTKTENLGNLYNLLIILRLYLVGISFIIYGNYKKLSKISSLIGSLTYTFSAFSLFALARHPYFINPLIIFPLLILSTEHIIKNNKPIPFIIMVFITFISSFYFGYMMSLCIMIYGIILVFNHYKNHPIKEKFTKLFKIFLYALIGVLLSSFIIIPTAYAYLNSTRTDNTIYTYTITYYKNLIETLISTNNTGSWSIIGISSIILAIIPTFIKNHKKHQDILLYLIILLTPLIIPFIGSAFAGFSYPNNRWTFVINFILSNIIAITLDKNYKINIKHSLIFITIYTIILLLIKHNLNNQLIISIICSIIFTYIIAYKQKLNKLYPIILITTIIINLGYNIYYMYSPNKNGYVNEFVESNTTKLYENANYQIPHLKEATNYLKKIDNSYYNTIIYPNKLYNLSLINNYNSTSYFYSIVNKNYLELAKELENQELGLNKEIKNFNQRTQINSLLNVKYFITNDKNYIPYGYELIKNYNNQTYIYKNKYHLSFANLYTNIISKETYNNLTPLEKENILLKATITNDKKDSYQYQSNIEKIDYIDTFSIINNNKIIINNKDNNYKIDIPSINNKEIYLYIKNIKFTPLNKKQKDSYNITVSINNKFFKEGIKEKSTNAYYFDNKDILINLGYYENLNEDIYLNFSSPGTYQFDSFEILSQSFDDYQTNINNLNNSNFNLIDYGYNYLSGTINPTNDGIIQFSTNYSDGWKVYIDDVEVDTFTSNKYFLGINIKQGHHKIYLKYTTPYKNIGIFISLISLIIFIIIIIKENNISSKNIKYFIYERK